jgi:adenylate kinase family enzyme
LVIADSQQRRNFIEIRHGPMGALLNCGDAQCSIRLPIQETVAMTESTDLPSNTFFIEVTGAGLLEVDGLFIPSIAPPEKSESGTMSTPGYWNGKLAWDRADGKSARSPAISYSNSYQSWRICRLDGHLAYDATCDDDLPPTDREWHVYKKGVAPAPKVTLHHYDPREPCPSPNVIFVLGGPGAGKGTMCELAELQLGWVHLSVGDLLRAERTAGGANAGAIEETIAAGKLVPDDVVVSLLAEKMETTTRLTGKNNFLIDGFPRSLSNLGAWQAVYQRNGQLAKMLYFECPYDVLEQRILGRAKYTGRVDDNIESLRLRFDTFKDETLPTVEYFKNENRCIEVDTSQDRQSVYDLVSNHLADFTDETLAAKPLTQRAEMLLGLRPFPKE